MSVLFVGYLGFVPGVSTLMGTDTAINLGVQLGQESFDSAYAKLTRYRADTAKTDSSAGTQSCVGSCIVNAELTSEEVSSLLRYGGFGLGPISKNTQIKIRADGKVEFSTLVEVDKLMKYVESSGLTDAITVKTYLDQSGILGKAFPVYGIASGSIADNKVNLNAETVKLGRLPVTVPERINRSISSALEKKLNSIEGLSIKSLQFENEKVRLEGTYPGK